MTPSQQSFWKNVSVRTKIWLLPAFFILALLLTILFTVLTVESQRKDAVVIEINGQMIWIFHGDVFDHTTKGSARLLARLGGYGYDWLILTNRMINWCLKKMGRPRVSFSKRIKNSVKKAVAWIADFEHTAASIAISKKYDTVICGHIHQPQQRVIATDQGEVLYLNSGDWVENLTALEYHQLEWTLYRYDEEAFASVRTDIPPTDFSVITEDIHRFFQTLEG